MAKKENLKPFTSENQPKNRGTRKGVPNRSTVLKKWLSASASVTHPTTKRKQKGTVEDDIILSLITKAREGDVPAIREILDTTYGKIKEQHEHAISFATFNDVVEQLGEEVVNAIQEIKLNETVSSKLLTAIERRWDAIRLKPRKTGDSRS